VLFTFNISDIINIRLCYFALQHFTFWSCKLDLEITCDTAGVTAHTSEGNSLRNPCVVAVAYAENFHRGIIQWHMVVICIWCALFATSQFDVIFMFPKQRFGEVSWHNMHILLHALSLFYVPLHWIWVISALSWDIGGNTLNATTQQFTTAKISGCALKKRSETHSSLRQSNLQMQNQAALMCSRIRAVEHRTCAAGLDGAHPCLHHRILLNYTRIDNAHKICKKTSFVFLLCIKI